MLTIAVAEREVRFVATLRKGTRVDHRRRRYCGFSGLSWPFPLCTATGLMPELVQATPENDIWGRPAAVRSTIPFWDRRS